MSVANSLTAEELRVLACLIEKSHTTPDQYPLSSNALTTACNQRTSRDPVVDYSTQLVDRTLQLLRDAGWARMIRGAGNRAFKHRHIVDEKLGLDSAQQALVAVLALRGPQSPGELKTRTERYHRFEDLGEVERALVGLSHHEPPLTRNLGRGPGQSQDRWIQLLGPTSEGPAAAAPATAITETAQSSHAAGPPAGRVVDGGAGGERQPSELEQRVARLERRLAVLERELGIAENGAGD